MHQLDMRISIFINSFANRSWYWMKLSPFWKPAISSRNSVSDCFLHPWFQSEKEASDVKVTEKRQILLYTLLVCIPGLVLVRALAFLLPFRQRPLFNPTLHLRLAAGFNQPGFAPWSSFPSDHTFLFFALATGMFSCEQEDRIFLYLHTILFIALPRLFLGIHYPPTSRWRFAWLGLASHSQLGWIAVVMTASGWATRTITRSLFMVVYFLFE